MPWEQEAGTPNPGCTFQRGQCETLEEPESQGSKTESTSVAGSTSSIYRGEQAKVRELALWEKQGPSQTGPRQGFTILSIRIP